MRSLASLLTQCLYQASHEDPAFSSNARAPAQIADLRVIYLGGVHTLTQRLVCSCISPAVQTRSVKSPGRPPPPAHSSACFPGQSRTPRPHHLCSPP